jgi:outer membrane protein assembly factor BamA
VFRHKSAWRANPAIDEGRMRSVIVALELDGRDNPSDPRRGGWLHLETETSGPRLRSDFTFTRYQAEARGYLPLTFGMDVRARLLAGTTGAGTLPYQKEFAVGGISTLRAHNYKYSRGNHVFLANAEYGLLLWRGRQRSGVRTNVKLLAFLDVGQAWQGPVYDLARRQMAVDAGLGLGLSDGRVRVYGARDLSAQGSGILWTVRLARPF